VKAHYPRPAAESGTVVLRFTNAAKDLYVSVNGFPVVEDAHTSRVEVVGVPAGRATIMIAAGSGLEKGFALDVVPGGRVEVPLAAPSGSFSSGLWQTFVGALVYVGYLSIRAAL
jgi:hypothetical protein